MSNARLWIGAISLYIILQIWCTAIEGTSMYNQALATDVEQMVQHEQTTTTTSLGNTITFFDKAWDFVSKVVFWDYTIFKDVDPTTGENTANQLAIFRYLGIAVGFVLLVDLVVILRRLTQL